MRIRSTRDPATLQGAVVPAFVGVLAYSAFAQGSYYLRQIAFVAGGLVVVAAVARRMPRPIAPAAVALGILGGALVASAAAAGWPDAAWGPGLTLVAAAATFVLARSAIRAGEGDRLLGAIAWIATSIAIIGLAGLALHASPWAMKAQGLWRTSSTLTYSNSAAALFTLAMPAPLVLLLRRPSALHRLQAFAIATGAVTTLSRGAAVGAIALLAVLTAFGRPVLARLIRPGLGALVASIGLLPSIASSTPRTPLALLALAAGAAVAGVPLSLSVRMRRVAAAAVALSVVVLAVPALSASENAAQFLRSRISRQSDDRTIFWRASLNTALEHPVLGTGPGTYRSIVRDGERFLMVFYVHNEYLQALAETGFVGLGAILGAIGVLAGWAWRRRPPPGTDARAIWAAAVAAGAAFCVHGFFDFMWRIPAVVLPAFVWLAFAVESKGRNPQ
ncbi:MAG: O-antigen ligase family protein [Actinomycetota bacterium]